MSNTREFRVIYSKGNELCEIRVENFTKGWRVQVLEGGMELISDRGLSRDSALRAYKDREKETLDQGYQLVAEETFTA